MHTIPQAPPEGGWLRARRERLDDGVDLRVHCPRRDREVSVTTCDGCGSALALASDDSGLSVYVRCAEADKERAPRTEVATPSRPSTGDPTFVPLTRIMRRTVAVTDVTLPAATLAESLIAEGIGAAPVVDEAGRLVGIVTKTDLLARGGDPQATAGDVMSPAPYSLHPDASIAEAAALMVYEGVHHLPVVDAQGRVVGVVSTLDVTRWVAQTAGFHAPAFGPALDSPEA